LVRGSSAFVRLPHSAHLGGGAQTFSFNSSLINPPAIPTAAQINYDWRERGIERKHQYRWQYYRDSWEHILGDRGIGNCNQSKGITVSGGANYGTPNNIPIQNVPVPAPPFPN